MQIPGLGSVTKDEDLGWYYSKGMPVPVLGGKMCGIAVLRYDDDPNKAEFHAAITTFLSLGESAIRDVEPYVFQYYRDINAEWRPDDDEFVAIQLPSEVWEHVQFGSTPIVERRRYGDKGVYVSIECECDWEPEHGLQIVFRGGRKICKVGP